MLKRKKVRERGKIKLSNYFQNLEEGERVSVVRDISLAASFPRVIQGRTGIIEGKRGDHYVVVIKDGRDKRFIIHPVHLKKIK